MDALATLTDGADAKAKLGPLVISIGSGSQAEADKVPKAPRSGMKPDKSWSTCAMSQQIASRAGSSCWHRRIAWRHFGSPTSAWPRQAAADWV